MNNDTEFEAIPEWDHNEDRPMVFWKTQRGKLLKEILTVGIPLLLLPGLIPLSVVALDRYAPASKVGVTHVSSLQQSSSMMMAVAHFCLGKITFS